MRDIGIRLVVDDSQKTKFAGIANAAARAQDDIESRLNAPLARAASAVNRLGLGVTILGTIAFRELTQATTALGGALGGLGKEFLNINEQFARLQITLGSSLKSMSAAKQVTTELLALSARSPLSIVDLGKVAQSISIMPQTSLRLLQQVQSGNVRNPGGFLQQTVGTVEKMGTFRPDQPTESAIFALREALGGQLRSLIRRYDIGTNTLQQMSGLTTKQLTTQPEKMMEAIAKLFSNIISPEAVTASSRQPTTLASQFYKQAVDIPLLSLGQEDKNLRSPYQAGLVRIQRVYDDLVKYMGESFEKTLAPKLRVSLGAAIDRIFDSVQGIVGKVMDKFGIAGSGAGVERVVTALATGLIKIIDFIADLVDRANSKSLIDSAINFVTSVFNGVKAIINFFIRLGEITTPFIATATAVLSPVILSNIGTITKFIAYDLPKGLTSLFTTFFATKDKMVAASAGTGILGRNTTRGSDPFNIPSFFNPMTSTVVGGGPTGDTYKRYAKALMSNPVFQGRLADELASSPAGLSPNIVRSNFIRQNYRSDLAYLSDPRNSGVVSQLTSSGRGGSALVGIGYAAQTEAAFASPRTSAFRTFGRAALGTLGGLALGAGVAVLTTAAVVGVEKLIEALGENSKALKDNADRQRAIRATTNADLTTPELRTLAAFAGQDIKERSKRATSDAGFDNLVKTLSAIGKLPAQGGVQQSWWDKVKAVFAQSAQMQAIAQGGPPPVDLGEVQRSSEMETLARFGVDSNVFDSALKTVQKAGGISENIANKLAGKFLVKPLEALNDLLDTVRDVPGGLEAVKAELEKQRIDIATKLEDEFKVDLKKKFGAYSDILVRIATGVTNPKDVNDLKTGLYRTAGIEDILAKSEQGGVISKDSFATEQNAQTEAAYRKNFKPEYDISNLERLAKVRTDTLKSIGDFVAEFESGVSDINTVVDRMKKEMIANADKFGGEKRVQEFAEALKGLDMKEQIDLWRNLIRDRRHQLSQVGDLFVVGLGSMYEQLSSLVKDLDKLPKEIFQERIEQINRTIELTDSAKVLPRLPVIKSPLTGNQGTDVERLASQAEASRALTAVINRLVEVAKAGFPALKQANPVQFFPVREPFYRSKQPFSAVSGPMSFGRFDIERADTTSTQDIIPQITRLPKVNEEANAARIAKQQQATVEAIQNAVVGTQAYNPAGLDLSGLTEAKKLLESIGYTADNQRRALADLFPITQGKTLSEQLRMQIELQKRLISLLPATEENAQKRVEMQRQLNELTEEQNRLIEQQKPSAFFKGLAEGLSTAQEELYNFAEIGKGVGTTIKDSMGSAFAEIVTGAKSAREAFRDMAKSILGYIAEIAMKMAVSQAVGMIIGSFLGGSANGAGVTSSGTAASGSVSGIGYYAGGGIVKGGSGTRDDVPMMLMGGEYVLNKKAANTLGYANLEKINRGLMPTEFKDGDIPVLAMEGEYVLSKRAAQAIGYRNLDRMNEGRFKHFSTGGLVPVTSVPASPYMNLPYQGGSNSSQVIHHSSTITVNIDQNGKPKTDVESSALQAKEMADEIDALIERKFAEKQRLGNSLNPIIRRS